jgi:L-ascorbate metabolism protein UlaG (beta-lactamase superfamily)
MQITKLGHCCLLIKEKNITILTDPGAYSEGQNKIIGIDLILITHEHFDHLHIDSLRIVLQNNPSAKIITNKGVGKLLNKENIAYELVEHGESTDFKGIKIEGFGEKHADVYPSITPVDNTGYFIAERFFYPGDQLTNPNKPIDILALPVAGPWLKISEAVDYAKILKPKKVFPVHDAMIRPDRLGSAHFLPQMELTKDEIEFIVLDEGKEYEI